LTTLACTPARGVADPRRPDVPAAARWVVAQTGGSRAEAIYSYEGTREINSLIVGLTITGESAFAGVLKSG
jgi:hypothetical protein